MKRLVIAVASIVALGAYLYFVFQAYPQAQNYRIARFVPEQRDGPTSYKPVWETRELQPSPAQIAQWTFAVVAGGLIVLFAINLAVLWNVDYVNRRYDQRAKQVERWLGNIFAFLLGILASYAGLIMKTEPDIEKLEMKATNQALLRALNMRQDAISTNVEIVPVPEPATGGIYVPDAPLPQDDP